MQTKSHEPSKEKESKESLQVVLSQYYGAYVDNVMSDKSHRPTDRIVETYRAILRCILPDTSFESTIDLMVSLGCFSSVKTKNELRNLFNLRKAELIS